jgi:hypothetical protein
MVIDFIRTTSNFVVLESRLEHRFVVVAQLARISCKYKVYLSEYSQNVKPEANDQKLTDMLLITVVNKQLREVLGEMLTAKVLNWRRSGPFRFHFLGFFSSDGGLQVVQLNAHFLK